MQQYDFNFPFKDLDGKSFDGLNAAKFLANELAQKTEGYFDPMKAMCIARPLYEEGIISLDSADAEKLKEFVLKSGNLTNLAKQQIVSVFN